MPSDSPLRSTPSVGLEPILDLQPLRERVESRLATLVPPDSAPPTKLHSSIRYSLLAPGKRIRPVLSLLAARSFGGDEALALDPACAIEMVHAASLIVDDFPCMDDATERRGRPTNHLTFGLDTATLASLALLNRAFGVLAMAEGLPDGTRVELVRLLASSLGDSGGAIAGQEEDLEAPDAALSIRFLESMVRHKTAALFAAAVESGACVAGASAAERSAARDYALNYGLCFQALDDLDDRPEDAPPGGGRGKATFVSLLGVAGAWRQAEGYAWQALAALEPIGLDGSPLAGLAWALIGRALPEEAVSGL